MSAPPRYLRGLELSGSLEILPRWITNLNTLNKLTLSMTALQTDTLERLRDLSLPFSLTFSLNAAKPDQHIKEILNKNKAESDGEIFVPGKGFESLKLLRFVAPLVPKLSFSEDAMPALERIEMQFDTFEGLFGIDTLKSLREVHLGASNQADEMTRFFVDYLKNTKGSKIISDHITAV